MLILGRKAGESVVIGDNIHVTILSVDASGNVTLGIDAPKNMLILRKELKQAAILNQESAITECPERLLQQLESAFSPQDSK